MIKIPIAILPGGTANSLSCDLGGEEPLNMCMNIIKGKTVKGDLLRVDFESTKASILATTIAWGYATQVIEASESYRNCLGTSRYTLCGAKEVL